MTTQTESPFEPAKSLVAPARIVGIGASAGGLESLERLFANLPPNPGMAFVVVQHLSPDFRSVMDELLGRISAMPVRLAEHDIEVQANHVYLLPPRMEIVIRGGRLQLSEKNLSQGLTLPIDQFLSSLADDQGERSVAVILSGTGSDGTRGLQRIKRAGGMVIVESPETARFNGMPMSALATGMVDYAVEAGDIPSVLIGSYRSKTSAEPEKTPLEVVFRLLRDQFGLDFSLYKTSTVSRRILRRVEMQGLGIGSVSGLEAYGARLRHDPEELSSLYHDLLIGVTRFFRDPEAFVVLEHKAIPEILKAVPPSEEIRVWVAGCATGEEAYSLAMLLYEALVADNRPLHVKILATDVHRASLEHASAGIYREEQLEFVSEQRRKRFFTRKGNAYQISQEIRQLIVFAPQNLIKDAPFTKMNLITCRNVLIYFEPGAQQSVLSLFHFGLATGGILFLGSSESMGPLASEFTAIDEHWKIYRKRRDVRLTDPLRVPVMRQCPAVRPAVAPGRSSQDAQRLAIYDQLLDRYMPPSFLVDEDRTLLESFGGAERFLKIGRRRPSTNLLDLVEGDLRTVIAGAIQKAMKSSGPFRYTGVPVPVDGTPRRWTLIAEPFPHPRTGGTHVLLSFEAEDETPHPSARAPLGGDVRDPSFSEQRLQTLESELAYTRETLQSAIEELQTSNEELQATNEELVASNEELQSTNEELHSVNEELYTVNAEYQKKIQELRELNADMQHLLEGTDVGTLFLDRELRIRKFTPRIASVFHIQPQDVGRDIRDFSHGLLRDTLFSEIEQTLRTGAVIEDEVRDEGGTKWFLRLLPYRSSPGAEPSTLQRGVVLSLTDISTLDRARARVEQLSAIVESSNEAIVGRSLDGVITAWNAGAERLYGYKAEEAIGRKLKALLPSDRQDEIDRFIEAVKRGERVEHIETIRVRKDGEPIDVSIIVSPIGIRDGEVVGLSILARDMTPLKRAQQELALREERLRMILDSTAEAILGLSPDGRITFCNPSCARILGYPSCDDLIGKSVQEIVRLARSDGSAWEGTAAEPQTPLLSVLRTGQGVHSEADSLLRADGSSFPAEYWSYPVWRDGKIEGAVVTFLDITHRKTAERELHVAVRRREQFLAMLGHELRNPLAAVLAATRVMQSSELQPGTIGHAREVIERQSAHMARLLDDLLDVSRITRGEIELRKEDLDLCEITRTSVEALGPLLAERRSDLELDLPASPAPVRGDPARLQQVVVNLVSNAARYSLPGSPIRLRIAVERDQVQLEVTDQGCGIEPEMRTAIFELFVQAHQGLERSRGGLGVGLTLVKKIVELHGGTVEAFSEGPGKGSTFCVTLSLQHQAILRATTDTRKTTVPRRVVLVEDQVDARQMMRLLLEANGHVVTEVADGATAVKVIEQEHPDVALVDIGLPVMSGYDVARSLRQLLSVDDVLLVALTGYGTAEDVRIAYAAGFDAHLTKPADPDRIEQILHRRRRR